MSNLLKFKTLLFFLTFLMTCGGLLLAQEVVPGEVADGSAQTEAELKAMLAELEIQIEGQRSLIQGKQRESTSLERDITILDAQINKIRLELRARNLSIGNLSSGIEDRTGLISDLEIQVSEGKISLSELLRRVDEMDSTSLVEILLGYDTLSEFFEDFSSFESIQKELQVSLVNIRENQTKTTKEKQILETRKSEELELRYIQELEKAKSLKKENEKQQLLSITKDEEAQYQKILDKQRASAAEIRARIFRLFGGGELHFEEALNIAQFAEQATGIRSAFILAVLAQESALDGIIGRNLGQCFYNTPANNSSRTVMSSSQKPSFLAIMREIGRDPNTTPVSCPIVSDGSHGGAMGPAQFMPRTWWDINSLTGYKKRISKITGNNPPSPFRNSDAFVGTSLYLKDAYNSSACVQYKNNACRDHGLCSVTEAQMLQERCAAAKYYAGNAWYKFRWAYGEPVVERAAEFQKDINTITQ